MSGTIINAASAIASILLRPQRSVGVLIPDCAIEEMHVDEMAVTEHPVENGAAISDHAYLRPSEVRLHYAWSNSSLSSLFDFSEGHARRIYGQLQALQASREPFDVVTGKRRYSNMVLVSVSVTTDRSKEYMLDVTMICRQVIIVSTQQATLPPAARQAQPQNTEPPQDAGVRQPVQPAAPRNQSVLSLLNTFRANPSGGGAAP